MFEVHELYKFFIEKHTKVNTKTTINKKNAAFFVFLYSLIFSLFFSTFFRHAAVVQIDYPTPGVG